MSVKDFIIKTAVLRWLKKQEELMKFLEGKKTYLVMLVTIILGGVDAYNQHCSGAGACSPFMIPGFVYSILGALGLWTRSVAKPKG